MSLKPLVRDNIALNAHEMGCKQALINQIMELETLAKLPKQDLNVLIIGGSSGYGLASRTVLAFKGNAFTYNVSFERAARGRNTASAGYYNNQFFSELAMEKGIETYDLNADAFAHETKHKVIEDFKTLNKKIDLVIYSVASGIRIDPDTQEKYVSSLKPIGQDFKGLSVDISKETFKEETLTSATPEEIENTRKVMGGEDYLLWMKALDEAGILNPNAKAITYTYVGSQLTYPIYKDGTIGHAKRDLEATVSQVQDIMNKYHGASLVSSSKTVVTKASVFIPTVALYASILFKVMKEEGTHETIVQHKYRLFNDFVFNDANNDSLIRLDAFELDRKTQAKVEALMQEVTVDTNLKELGFDFFKQEFMRMNGFEVDGFTYE